MKKLKALREVTEAVNAREEFTCNRGRVYSQKRGGLYIVFSYGDHFPMFVCDGMRRYVNTDKFSISTSNHQSHLPHDYGAIKRTTRELKELIEAGGEAELCGHKAREFIKGLSAEKVDAFFAGALAWSSVAAIKRLHAWTGEEIARRITQRVLENA